MDLVEFVPKFAGKKDSYKRIANMSAWATQPQRMGFVDDIPSPPSKKKRPRLPSNGSSNPVKKKKKTTL
jgi:hypothetical protein